MTFEELLDHALAMLQRRGRMTYRTLQRQFNLDDTTLDDLKEALLYERPQVVDDPGHGLLWRDEPSALPQLTPGLSIEDARSTHAEAAPARPPRPPDAERRQLTVMFCDLVGSTPLSQQLDPEELREVMRAYQQTCTAVIQRFDGHIAQHLGDGLLVYFGYPQAHEDDVQRAAWAGLEIVEAIRALNHRLAREKGLQVAVRLGIHTGLVVVGEVGGGGRQEQLALGETPNVAARLQALATPNTVVISATTYRLLQGMFLADDLGPHHVKGMATSLQVYRVRGASEAHSRFEVAASRGLTPLVGREQEVGFLIERWAQAKEAMGQVVLLTGEAGIGKSRLIQVVKERLAGEPHVRYECRCSPYYQHSMLYPVVDLLQRALQFEPEDLPDARLTTLERFLSEHHLSLEESVPLLASLLALPIPDCYPPLNLAPERQKQKTLEAVIALLVARAMREPLLFIVEDLHWVDPSTLELLDLLIDQTPTVRILTLLTFRPEFHPPWPPRGHLAQLTVNRLPQSHVEVMVQRVTGGKTLPAEVCQQVVAKTDGVPLFVEELTKMVLESGLLQEREDRYELGGPLPPLAIPATLRDSLMARLDRLVTAKEVAQLGAALGRVFPYELLRAVSLLDEAMLQRSLQQLIEAELLYQRGLPPQATYLFKHALIQDVAYQSLLKSTRQQYHQRIAQVLAERFPEAAETQPELLAHHFTEAGLNGEAVGYWHRAGQRAMQRSANLEAIAHFTKALELMRALPDSPDRLQQELALLIALGPALQMAKGFGAAEVEHVYARAHELCGLVGETPQLFPALWGLWLFHFNRRQHRAARTLGEQLLTLAQHLQDPALILQAHHALWPTLAHLGELTLARAHIEQGLALYDPQWHRSHAFLYGGHDPAVCGGVFGGLVLWALGYPDQALARIQDALQLAARLSHPYSLALAGNFAAVVYQQSREIQAARRQAEATMALSAEQGFPQWLACSMAVRGWALIQGGDIAAGMAEVRQGSAAWFATGSRFNQPYFSVLLAEGHWKQGESEAGLQAIAEGLEAAGEAGEQLWEAELHRLKGELLLARSPDAQGAAEASFHRALEVARRQQVKSLELRAAMSLARLRRQQGRSGEALQLLAECYSWFTEGFDTVDLQEANALLQQLG